MSTQLDILSLISTWGWNCAEPEFLPFSASNNVLYKLPVIIKFNYIENNVSKFMYCYYDLYFKYFPTGKIKIYSLNFIREIESTSNKSIKNYISYINKTEGFFSSEFSFQKKWSQVLITHI